MKKPITWKRRVWSSDIIFYPYALDFLTFFKRADTLKPSSPGYEDRLATCVHKAAAHAEMVVWVVKFGLAKA